MELFIIIMALGVFSGFFVQTVLGFGGSLVALPIMLYVMPLQEAIAYISIFYVLSSVYLVKKEWDHMDRSLLKKLVITSVIGVTVGILILRFSQPLILKKALGVFIILYVLHKVVSTKPWVLSNKVQFVFGLLGGLFSGLFSTGGPLYVFIVNSAPVSISTFRATMFGVLAMVTVIRIPLLAIGGILNWSQLHCTILIFPAFIASLWLGKKVYEYINKDYLRKIILAVLLISGISLVIN